MFEPHIHKDLINPALDCREAKRCIDLEDSQPFASNKNRGRIEQPIGYQRFKRAARVFGTIPSYDLLRE
jgi:hypothetical protein